MTIIFSMAGLSQRFINAGFVLPKYMLYVGNKSLFNISVSSFSNYFNTCKFVFIARHLYDTQLFIEAECNLMGIADFEIVILEKPTRGQAETVELGLALSSVNQDEPITIFNIDTFRNNFRFPDSMAEWDGYLEVFYGEGNNWSYAKTESETSTRVTKTAEKKPISNYCSTGLYYFRTAQMFLDAFATAKSEAIQNGLKEWYVAPIYNTLICKQKNIHIALIDRTEVNFCGVPDEYYLCLAQYVDANRNSPGFTG